MGLFLSLYGFMSCTYENIKHDGHTLDRLTSVETGLRIAVTRSGAELVSLARRNKLGGWIGFLYRDGDVTPSKSGWNNHATVMGYFTHRLKNGHSNYLGHEIHSDIHGFLRHLVFDAPVVGVNSLTYRVDPEQIPEGAYPFKVSLALIYAIEGEEVHVTFHFENHEPDAAAQVSFGLHPGFAAGSFESAEIILPPGKYVRHLLAGHFLSGETEEIDFEGGPMPFPLSQLPGSILLDLTKLELPIFTFVDKTSGHRMRLNYCGVPYLTLWSDGGPFVCLEPTWGLPDHLDQRPFEQKEGLQEIKPSGTLTRSFMMTPLNSPEFPLSEVADLTGSNLDFRSRTSPALG